MRCRLNTQYKATDELELHKNFLKTKNLKNMELQESTEKEYPKDPIISSPELDF